MGLKEVFELEERNKALSQQLRIACDKLNDAIAGCTRSGLTVFVEVFEDSSTPDSRPVVIVRPHVTMYY